MTTIVLVRKNNEVVVAGDGQVSMGNTVVKSTASKVRKIEKRDVVAGFAGSTADALTLFERLEAKIEKHAGNLSRAAVELAKDWRTDKYLRRLEALMAIGDKDNSYIISGTGDVLEPEGDVIVGTKRATRKVKVEEFVRRESALDNVPDNFVERMMASSATGGQVSTKKDVIVPEGFAVSIAYNKGGYQVVPKEDL